MKNIHDVRKLLMKFGTLIYTKDRLGDLELMMMEINELYEWKLIDVQQFQQAVLLLKKEIREYKKGTGINE
ncbi:YqgQ family protein [Oceanobacillus jeddahense]|uniref:YqgQ family protein n=1 Tax=Oceanobacillus jeddahense TaxID=1462527 RepID=A0ABY5JM09_9BACI|nr:YqgQ family protein [Oceanobacillus jeddahense]UUI01337.1 YqgQ family protein [Oceanobacillus jeddahense]